MTVPEITQRIQSLHVFLIASMVVHVLLLCLPLQPPIARNSPLRPDRLFAVGLYIPETAAEDTNAADTSAPPALKFSDSAAQPAAQKKPRPSKKTAPEKRVQGREATVSLDRLSDADAQYRSYLAHLRSQINAVWQYQQEVRDRGLSGIATVRFSIAHSGRLESVTIKQPSGHRVLDDEALRTIRAAAPFLPFPAEFTIETLHVWASFEYEFNLR